MRTAGRATGVLAALLVVPLLLLQGCANSAAVSVGHSGGPLVGALYLAAESPAASEQFAFTQLGTAADVGYALVSGDLDAGFVDPARIEELSRLPGFDELTLVGKVTFPYGATVIAREGLDIRLEDIPGLRIGISGPACTLFTAFEEDARQRGVDTSTLDVQPVAFDAMIPALEAAEVDLVVIRGAFASVAVAQGHSILYQNWEVDAGDPCPCCPATLAQLELILLARTDSPQAMTTLPQTLADAQAEDPNEIRAAIARNTVIAERVLADLPVPEFQLASESLLNTLLDRE